MEQGNQPPVCSQRFLGICIVLAALILAAALLIATRAPGSCPLSAKPAATPPVVAPPTAPDTTTPTLPSSVILPPTGTWTYYIGDQRSGTAYLRCENRKIVWMAQSLDSGKQWTHVFTGTMDDNGIIRGEWYDMPPGYHISRGRLTARYSPTDDALLIMERTGGFSGTQLSRVKPGSAIAPPPAAKAKSVK